LYEAFDRQGEVAYGQGDEEQAERAADVTLAQRRALRDPRRGRVREALPPACERVLAEVQRRGMPLRSPLACRRLPRAEAGIKTFRARLPFSSVPAASWTSSTAGSVMESTSLVSRLDVDLPAEAHV